MENIKQIIARERMLWELEKTLNAIVITAQLDPKGRVVIPKWLRTKYNLSRGCVITLEFKGVVK